MSPASFPVWRESTMKPSFTLVLIAPLALLAIHRPAVHARANDMYPTRAAAEKRAKELNCSGAFAMGRDWMPCRTFETYQRAIQKKSH